jgi:hypothetical protein
MNYFYLCIKTVYAPGLSIGDFKGDSVAYCKATRAKVLAYALGEGPINALDLTRLGEGPEQLTPEQRAFFLQLPDDPDWTVVAHHAEFATAAWEHCLGLPALDPKWILCTEQFARLKGLRLKSYSLAGLGKYFGLAPRIPHNPLEGSHSIIEMIAVARRDVELCREIHLKLQALP